jgi:hypothetical protein
VVDGSGQLPLLDRDGNVVAVVQLDLEDLERVSAHRWHQHANGGYVVRSVHGKGRTITKFLAREVLGLPDEDAPRVFYVDGNPLNLRKKNLRVSPQVLARRLADDPSLRAFLTKVAYSQGAVA